MRRKGRLWVSLAVVLGAIAYLSWVGYREAAMYYYTVSEVAAQADRLSGKRIRVLGDVVRESIDYDSRNLVLSFRLTEGGRSFAVTYYGVKPDMFETPGAQAVVEGRIGADGRFVADNLLVKCPSKYESGRGGG